VTPGTTAARLGLRAHDIILAIDNKPVMQEQAVAAALGERDWAQRELRVMRAGRLVSLRAGP
jgi:S1-C subfamily serine protease